MNQYNIMITCHDKQNGCLLPVEFITPDIVGGGVTATVTFRHPKLTITFDGTTPLFDDFPPMS